MASRALQRFNELIDGTNLPAQGKVRAKELGELLYIEATKETILHLRKHLVAVVNDSNTPAERKQLATILRDIADEMGSNSGSWWLDIQSAIEGN